MTLLPADRQERSTTLQDFRFDGVLVDQARFRLLVDGSERAVQPLALRLLLVLCEAEGRVVPRRELFDRLWPRQDIGDESLTQQTARLREALGAYGNRLITVRRVGLRLDASIERVDATAIELELAASEVEVPLIAPSTLANDAIPPKPPVETAKTLFEGQTSRRQVIVTLLVLAILAIAIVLWPRSDAPILGSQGLTEADLSGEKPSTANALRRALTLDAQGRRDEAIVLLKITLQSDPQAALPAAYLALIHHARGEREEALRWKSLALQRLHNQPAERIRLLLHPIEHLRTLPDSETLATLSLIATTKSGDEAPSLSRAHAHLGRSEFAAARAQLEALAWADIDPVNIPLVLGDLAALGSPRAQTLFRAQETMLHPSMAAETRARFAATRGDFSAASAQMAIALAAHANDRAWARQSLLYLYYTLQAEQFEVAQAMIGSLKSDPRLHAHPKLAFDVALLQLGLPDLSDEGASTVLAEAFALAKQMDFAPDCWEVALLAAARHVPTKIQVQCAATPAELASVPGLAALLDAAGALGAGQRQSAIDHLQEASRAGIDQSLYAAHANALRSQLGLPTLAQPSFDPPYPVWSRHTARRLSRN